MIETNAMILERSDGNPILVHFGPGCTIGPKINPNTGEAKDNYARISVCGGPEFTVRGDWRKIATKAGYGKVVAAAKKHRQAETTEPTEPKTDDSGGNLAGDKNADPHSPPISPPK